ncbi:unnamed protein product [marine sediment metagenome]|uniref:6-pyruvoyl tetrahydrobiopterin synthase n=1 Tax=marine sediment metagenome TaxID=412755 RepID=X1D243_9ZZZZ
MTIIIKTSVTKCFEFEMGHILSESYDEDCQQPHGHSYKLEVTFSGPVQENGVIVDFKKMNQIITPIVKRFDHTFLSPQTFGRNPTAENMALNIFHSIEEITTLMIFSFLIHLLLKLCLCYL